MVVSPATGFAAIAAALEELGLEPGPDDAVTPPAMPGEREFAYWTAPVGDALVHYSFNPVVRLRVLVFSGGDALRWKVVASERLPGLGPADLRALLVSAEPRDVLLGLFAAVELKAGVLLADIEPLRIHRCQRISQAAARASEALARAALELGAERLAAEQRRHPDRSALFQRSGDAAYRREVVVWLWRDGHSFNEDVAKVLRAAFVDSDWRVRVAAMLVAVRLKASALWPDVRRIDLPTTSRSGLDAARRSLLVAARKAALAELAGEPLPLGTDDKARLMRHLRDVVAGREGDRPDGSLDWLETWLDLPAD
jgi:hypothetical protein